MKTEPIPRPVFAFALILALNAMSVSAETCLDLSNPKADIWFDCWDCRTQCHGDADCDGLVYTYELLLFNNLWKTGGWPVPYSDWRYDPCLDFDRDLDIDDSDVGIIEDWYHPRNGPPPDCPGQPPADPLVLHPVAEDVLFAGYNYTINWEDAREGSCSAHRYMLYYSIDAGANWLPVDTNSIDYTCSYEWLIPPVMSDQCLLRIDDLNDPTAVTDTLDELFTILECDGPNILNLQTPETGQFVLADSNCTITWSDCRVHNSQTRSYKLYYSIDLGKPWVPIDPNPIYALSYDWPVPPDLNGLCYLAVTDANDPTIGNIMFDGFYIYHCDEEMPADLDGNCYVDFRDYGMLVSNWPTGMDFSLILELAEQWCDCGNPYDPACGY